MGEAMHFKFGVQTDTGDYIHGSDVNKDLTLKAKAKAKDRTFEGLNRELDI